MKTCNKCSEEKELSEFGTYHRRGKIFHKGDCKVCESNIIMKWREDNPEKYAIQLEKNRKVKSIKYNYDPNYKEKILQQQKLCNRKNQINIAFRNARRRANEKGLEFTIELQNLVVPEFCPLLGIPIFAGSKGDYDNSATIDRINNLKGYTYENIRIISCKANTMKNSASKEELLEFAKNIVNYLD